MALPGFLRWLPLLTVPALSVACAATDVTAESAGEVDEIRTAECPLTVGFSLAKPKIDSRTPTTFSDGSALSTSELDRVTARMASARAFATIDFSLKLTAKGNAKCSYISARSTAPSAPRAELRGTAAKPFLDVTFGDFHYYAFPKTYAPSGLAFDSGANASVFAQVGTASAPSRVVKIGSASVLGVPGTVDSAAIAAAVRELQTVLEGPGRNDVYQATGTTPLAMVKSYIREKYGDDQELGDEYRFVSDATHLEADELIAGTLRSDVAVSEAMASVTSWYESFEDDSAQRVPAKARAALEKIVAAGGTFGFDGFEQNGCAAPTGFLLVLDAAGHVVYGIDLNPCDES